MSKELDEIESFLKLADMKYAPDWLPKLLAVARATEALVDRTPYFDEECVFCGANYGTHESDCEFALAKAALKALDKKATL